MQVGKDLFHGLELEKGFHAVFPECVTGDGRHANPEGQTGSGERDNGRTAGNGG